MSRQIRVILALTASAAALAACAVSPSYKTPPSPEPAAKAFVSPIPPASVSADQPPPQWWKLYNDAAIDQLVTDALEHNKSLQVAAANLAEARGALTLARAPLFPTNTFSGAVMDSPDGSWIPPARRLTTSSASSPRLRKLSWIADVMSSGESAGFHDPSDGRTAPTLLTMVRPTG